MKTVRGIFILLYSMQLNYSQLHAQCGAGTPVFTVDLSKNPDSTWLSSAVTRNDTCCGSSPCVEFIVTLSSNAQAIALDIYSGAQPSGSLYYNVGCSGSVAIGTPICLSGAGPHMITFCKPGGNQNVYRIHSIVKPNAGTDIYVRDGCTATLNVTGFVDSTIHWQSLTNDSVYNSYLSCSSGCSTTYVTPKTGRPNYVDYMACGKSGVGCSGTSCDTVRVNFINTLKVSISPDTPSICYLSNITLKANPSGGKLPYKYIWNTGDTTQTITVSAGGIYWVKLNDATNCPATTDSDLVKIFTLPIAANAGNDTVICSSVDSAKLNGKIQAASGGIWSGGTGTFNPNRTTLNPYYKPSISEIAAGSVSLILTSTGNSSCQPAHDTMNIIISKWPVPAITGADSTCQFTANQTYSTPSVVGDTYSWTVTGGTITSGAGTNSIIVSWGGAGSGSVKVAETNAAGCKSTINKTVKINTRPIPAISGPVTICEYSSGISYSTVSHIGDKYQWTISGGTILSGATSNAMTVSWGPTGTGSLSVTETNPSGCDTQISKTITIQPRPVPAISGADSICQFTPNQAYSTPSVAGDTYSWTVTGGTITSGAGTNSIVVSWGAAGSGAVKVAETNSVGCQSIVSKTVKINARPVPAISGPVKVCEFSSGNSYSTTSHTGDKYQWSISGGTIQSGATSNSITVYWGSSTGTGNLTLTETNPSGCDTQINKTIYIQQRPQPKITGPDTTCANKSTSTYSTPLVSGDSYSWNVSGGTIMSGSGTNSIVVKSGNPGSAAISLTETDSLGCDTTISKTIGNYSSPAPAITGADSICQFSTNQAYSTPSVVGDTYSWTVTGGIITSGAGTNSIVTSWGGAGSGTVKIAETNPAGCQTIVNKTIKINTKAIPAISGLVKVCEYSSGNAYSTTFNNGDKYQWSISGGTILSGATSNAITVTWGPTGTGSLTLTETNPSGCDTQISKPIAIQPRPKPALTGADSICQFTANQTYSTPSVAGDTYSWTVTGGTITSGAGTNSIVISWGGAGSGTIKVAETNSVGCQSIVSKTVKINTKPIPAISGPVKVCEYSSGNSYSTVSHNGDKYQWSISGGNILSGATSNAITVYWASSSGTGSLTLIETNPSGCDTQISKTIYIQQRPQPKITGPDTTCANKSISTYATPLVSGDSYSWQVTGCTIISGSGTNSIVVKSGNPGSAIIGLTETDSLVCDTTISKTIGNYSSPVPAIIGADSICQFTPNQAYSTPSVTGDTYSWTVTGGTITSGAGTNSIVISWGNAGFGTVKIAETNPAGCQTIVSKTIKINTKPIPAISGPVTVCEYSSGNSYSTTSRSGDKYQWSISGGTILSGATSNAITVSWGSSAGTGSLSLTETNPSGCDTQINKTINIQPRPAPAITGPDTTCANKSVSTYAAPLVSGDSYSWNVSGGTIMSGSGTNAIVVKSGNPGPAIVSLTETNSLGCDSTISKTIENYASPVSAITGADSICQFSTNQAYSTPFFAGDTYGWTVTGGTITSGAGTNSVIVNWGRAGSGAVKVVETNIFGCQSIVSKTVKINTKPIPAISGPVKVCEYSSGVSYSAISYSGDKYQWSINGGTILSGTTSNAITVSWGSSTGSGSLSLTETNPSGCDTQISQAITVQPRPQPQITGPDTACANKSVSTYSTPFVSGDSYLWKVSGGFIISGSGTNAIVVKSGNPGPSVISLTETNSLGCDFTISKTIENYSNPATSILGKDTVCKFSTETYYAPLDFYSAYTWSVSGGTFRNGKMLGQIIISWSDVGIGVITLKQTNKFGCDTTIKVFVVIAPLPVPVISGKDSLCEFETGSIYSVNYEAGSTYQWFVTGGSVTGKNTDPSIVVNWGPKGVGNVKIIQSNSLGCDTTVQIKVSINPKPAPTINGFSRVCENRGGYIYTTKAVPGSTYDWTAIGGTILTDSGNKITVLWGKASLGSIKLREINTFGCENSDTIAISIENHTSSILKTASTVCIPANVQFRFPADSNIISNTWDFGDGTTSNALQAAHQYKTPGDYTATLITQNALGCTDTAYDYIKVYSRPIADFAINYPNAEKVLYNREDLLVLVNNSKYATRYLWNIGDSTKDSSFEPPPHMFDDPGRYLIKLYAWNQHGCEDSLISQIDVETHVNIYIPNVFTPGNNKLNTYFSISAGNIVDFHVLIYNRWGEKMFESFDKNFKWDGTFNGAPVPLDVYIYIIKAKDLLDRDVIRKGNITVLR